LDTFVFDVISFLASRVSF